MPRICLCVNQVAKIRNMNKSRVPDPASVAIAAEVAGIDGIIAHLYENRTDITDRDVTVLKEVVQTHLNLAIPMNDDMVKKAMRWLPDMVTLLPAVHDSSKDGFLDISTNVEYMEDVVAALRANNIVISALIKPDAQQIRAAARLRLDFVQFNTAFLSRIQDLGTLNEQVEQLKQTALVANKLGLGVSVGRGLDYQNLRELGDVTCIEEYNIGTAVIARSILVGIERAIKQIKGALQT
ncbi:pyridoxine 5'-phosphate synthase [candidate division KSB1 bacterium]|nr:pyridoxine 5'-phosphate synthase [candidate division KSB1 bacterium]